MTAAPFDAATSAYDDRFTDTALGRIVRQRVWEWLDDAFMPGDRVLELGCGTGADAVHLAERGVAVVATDVSQAMLAATRHRVSVRMANDLVSVARLDLDQLGGPGRDPVPEAIAGCAPFDGAFSDFGAIDCVRDRHALVRGLATMLRPGGRLVLVTMPPVCPWETGWYAVHGDLTSATRRWRSDGSARLPGGATIRVAYPSVDRLVRELTPWFRVRRTGGIGAVLPPTELALSMERHPRLLATLAAADRWVGHSRSSRWAADHAVVDAVRI